MLYINHISYFLGKLKANLDLEPINSGKRGSYLQYKQERNFSCLRFISIGCILKTIVLLTTTYVIYWYMTRGANDIIEI